jgi:hypothetical protein
LLYRSFVLRPVSLRLLVVAIIQFFGFQLPSLSSELLYREINLKYFSQVRPLIEKNCLSCHGQNTLNPWYRDLPIIDGYINSHIEEAKSKLEMGDGFPFKGNGKQTDILWSVVKSIELERMPPFNFYLMHKKLKFNKKQKTFLLNWFKKTRLILLKEDL